MDSKQIDQKHFFELIDSLAEDIKMNDKDKKNKLTLIKCELMPLFHTSALSLSQELKKKFGYFSAMKDLGDWDGPYLDSLEGDDLKKAIEQLKNPAQKGHPNSFNNDKTHTISTSGNNNSDHINYNKIHYPVENPIQWNDLTSHTKYGPPLLDESKEIIKQDFEKTKSTSAIINQQKSLHASLFNSQNETTFLNSIKSVDYHKYDQPIVLDVSDHENPDVFTDKILKARQDMKDKYEDR